MQFDIFLFRWGKGEEKTTHQQWKVFHNLWHKTIQSKYKKILRNTSHPCERLRSYATLGLFYTPQSNQGTRYSAGCIRFLENQTLKLEQVLAKELNQSHEFRWKIAEPIQNEKEETNTMISGLKSTGNSQQPQIHDSLTEASWAGFWLKRWLLKECLSQE